MIESIIGLALFIGYIIFGLLVISFFRKHIDFLKPITQLIIISFLYTIFFGIGLIGGGGDPGFAFPFPLLLIAMFDIWVWVEWKIFINGFIIPLFFWWLLIFLIMLLRYWIKRRRL